MKDTALNARLTEVWFQDNDDPQLWHGDHGVILNTAALDERSFYFDLVRVAQQERTHAAPQNVPLR